ncbi:unnamed protein product [Paramecium pentaurelia]|uniref:Uncharacterized protein n=1 Tax=Paramecium pentaurelia TaxID=43138 RepID=A0A8S1RRK7_9CILI|nr:unnamed protein product [Paramecium pentaurelia]
MNQSQSTYTNNSRFVSLNKDPLEKYKQGLRQKFIEMYDQIEEQRFNQPITPQEGTIFLTEQQSLRSLLNSSRKPSEVASFHEECIKIQKENQFMDLNQTPKEISISYTQKRNKNRIFDPLPNINPIFKRLHDNGRSLLQQSNIKQQQQEQICQTSFIIQKENKVQILSASFLQPKSSIGIQTADNPIKQETIQVQCSLQQSRCDSEIFNIQSYLDRHYDYYQYQQHSNWNPNISELKLQNMSDDYQYTFCNICKEFVKNYNNQNNNHQKFCKVQIYQHTLSELIGKFQYLLSYEINLLRDFDEMCKCTRRYCYAGLEICTLLIQTQSQKRIEQLKQDLIKVNLEIQKNKNKHSLKIAQLFQYLILQLQN